MKFTVIALTALLAISSTAHAEKIADTLANTKTNHLQLLANNLNLAMIMQGDEEIQNTEFPDDINPLKFRFSAHGETGFTQSINNYLSATFTFSAPVSKVTKKTCSDLLYGFAESFRTGQFTDIIKEISFYNLTQSQLDELINSTVFYTALQASENSELKITCSE